MAMKTRVLSEVLFATPGEVVEGRLMRATPIRYKDGGTNVEYILKRTSGGLCFFRGTSMLNKLLFPDDVGKVMCIKFEGLESREIAEGMSPRKIFDVQVDEDSKVSSAPLTAPKPHSSDGSPEITDDDIPF